MFIVKMVRNGIMINVTVMEKDWSETMLTHSVKEISSSRFILRSSAKKWADKNILDIINTRYGLEYING